VTVQTGKVAKQELSSLASASGQIRPPSAKFANVNANTYGKITEIFVKEGDQVTKGQLLLKTESVQQEADVDAQQAALKTQIPLGRLGSPEDIAHAVAFLASPQAGYITGTTLHVNGGIYKSKPISYTIRAVSRFSVGSALDRPSSQRAFWHQQT